MRTETTFDYLATIPPLPPSAILSNSSSKNKVYKKCHTKPMPLIGYGTSNRSQSEIYDAIKAGARHLDCASLYGNEAIVGKALSQFITENPFISRSHFFITTKVWCEDYEPNDMYMSVRQSLHRLNIEYVDCILLHWPFVMRKYCPFVHHSSLTIKDVWKYSLEPILTTYKLTNYIGVSNFDCNQLYDLLKCDIPPCVNQIECHINFGQGDLVNFCHENGVHVVAWSPLSKGKYLKTNNVGSDIALKWLLQRGIGVIPSSKKKKHVEENMSVWKPILNLLQYDELYENSDKHFTKNLEEKMPQPNKDLFSLVDYSPVFLKNVSFIGPVQYFTPYETHSVSNKLNQSFMKALCSFADPGRRIFPDFIGIWPSTSSYTSLITGKLLHLLMSLICNLFILIGYPISLTELGTNRFIMKERLRNYKIHH